jgi:hypothetical protein
MAVEPPTNSSPAGAPDAVAVPAVESGPTPRGGPPPEWQNGLYARVVNAIYALPSLFKTSLNIVGVRATDLHTLNTTLGASIEQSVVDNLNTLRKIWDPDDQFQLYAFVRQPQVFPDVRLQTDAPNVDPQVLMGLELKGWFALAKEGEPSFRYTVSPEACAPADLLVVFPWMLDEIVSGTPKLLRPFVSEARYAAEHRNHYWTVLRGVAGDEAVVRVAENATPYPRKGDRFNDEAVRDRGNNFGRVARGNIMSTFVADLMLNPVAGIPLGAWQRFFKIFSDGFTEETVRKQLRQVETNFSGMINQSTESKSAFENFVESVEGLLAALGKEA